MKFPVTGLCLCLLTLMITGVTFAAPLKNSKPNIILVMTDDQGYGPVGKHGNTWIKTPALDKMYDESTRFTRFLVAPTCAPTRSALMTGRHPMRNGVTHTILERERMTLKATILPQILKQGGYTSGIFGKWHLGDEAPYQPRNRGFDKEFIHGAGGIGQKYACSCADAPNNKYFDPIVRDNGEFKKTKGYCTNIFFSEALGWIKEQADAKKPFFAYIATNAPHSPFISPKKNEARFLELGFDKNNANFYGMIENIDENMARLFAFLDKQSLNENTLVIFMSDNGTTGVRGSNKTKSLGRFKDGKEIYRWNAGMKGLKGSADEGGVRVPFFVRWKGHVKAGKDVHTIAAHIDLLPTLCDITGTTPPKGQVEGRSLVPLIDGDSVKWEDRFLVTHKGRWKTGENPDKSQWKGFAIRNQKYRFVSNDSLFDMEKDPGQTKNIIDKHPEIVKEMREFYDKWWKETRPLMVNESAPMSKTWPFHVDYYAQEKSKGIPAWTPPKLD